MFKQFMFFAIALVTALAMGPIVIPRLKALKFGQSIREEGPQSHIKKTGTPTMGGIIIVVGFLTPILLSLAIEIEAVLLVVMGILAFGAIGFADDYIIVVKKDNAGLSAKQKLILQVLVSLVLVIILSKNGTDVYVPFYSQTIQLGIWYYLFMMVILVGFNNAVNLTDGLDGLAASVTLIVSLGFAGLSYLSDAPLLVAVNLAMSGALIGYLKYNWHPAKIFMGDTGSLALGGYVVVMAGLLKVPVYLPIIGLIYLIETLSVIIQVLVFKRTRKRVFKMTPIHHHFELSGWSEKKIVYTFSLITVMMVVLSWIAFDFGGIAGV